MLSLPSKLPSFNVCLQLSTPFPQGLKKEQPVVPRQSEQWICHGTCQGTPIQPEPSGKKKAWIHWRCFFVEMKSVKTQYKWIEWPLCYKGYPHGPTAMLSLHQPHWAVTSSHVSEREDPTVPQNSNARGNVSSALFKQEVLRWAMELIN